MNIWPQWKRKKVIYFLSAYNITIVVRHKNIMCVFCLILIILKYISKQFGRPFVPLKCLDMFLCKLLIHSSTDCVENYF